MTQVDRHSRGERGKDGPKSASSSTHSPANGRRAPLGHRETLKSRKVCNGEVGVATEKENENLLSGPLGGFI